MEHYQGDGFERTYTIELIERFIGWQAELLRRRWQLGLERLDTGQLIGSGGVRRSGEEGRADIERLGFKCVQGILAGPGADGTLWSDRYEFHLESSPTLRLSGPALDVFFLGARMDRFSTIAKAVAQTFSHLLKISYFSSLLSGSILVVSAESMPFSPWLIPGLAAVAAVGSYLGRLVLDRLSDRRFLATTRWVASGIGVIWFLRGVLLLMVG